MRQIKVYAGHEYVSVQSNVANTATPIFTLEPPANSFIDFERLFVPVIKLLDDAGEQIDPASKVSVAVIRPNQDVPSYLPGTFTLQDFYDLTTAEQRNADNQRTLQQDLGKGAIIREQEQLVFYLNSPDVVDWSQRGAFEFPVQFDAV